VWEKVQLWLAEADSFIRVTRQPEITDRRRLTGEFDGRLSLHQACESPDWLSSSARCGGAVLCIHLYTRTASFKSIRYFAFNQWSWRRSGLMCGDTWRRVDNIYIYIYILITIKVSKIVKNDKSHLAGTLQKLSCCIYNRLEPPKKVLGMLASVAFP